MTDANRLESSAPTSSVPELKPVTATGALPMPRSLLTAGIALDPETEREREARMEELKGELGRMLAQGNGAAVIDRVLSLVVDLERENERFAWRLLRELRYRFGRKTEKLTREELAQFFLALGGDEEAAKGADFVVPAPAPPCDADPSNESTTPEPEPGKPPKPRKREPGGGIKIGAGVERHVNNILSRRRNGFALSAAPRRRPATLCVTGGSYSSPRRSLCTRKSARCSPALLAARMSASHRGKAGRRSDAGSSPR